MSAARSTTARWAQPIALLALLVAIVAAVLVAGSAPGYRFGWWSVGSAFGLMRIGAYVALAGLAVALAAGALALLARRWMLAGLAALALALAAGSVAVPNSIRGKAASVPGIHDITTDTEDPPEFQAVLPLRSGARNPPEYGGAAVAEQQRRGYPQLGPAFFREAPAAVIAAAEGSARRLGWEVVAVGPATGRLEAVATTAWFGFKDDVVVRARAGEGGTRVDVRSKSRIGRSDLGKNAQRIWRFLADLRGSGLTPVP